MMSRSTVRTVIVLVLTTAAILVGLWVLRSPSSEEPSNPSVADGLSTVATSTDPNQAAPSVGGAAPDFTVQTIDGATISLAALQGQPVWLVFGATWCSNCRAEAPDVEAVAVALQDRAQVVSIYVGESTATVSGYAARLGLTHPQVADPTSAVASAYAVLGVPAHFFIDSDGRLAQIVVGTITRQRATEILGNLD